MSIALPPPQPSDDFARFDLCLDSFRRFTVAEYHALVDAACFADDEDYELLEGLLVHKMGKKRAHSLVTRRLRQLLEALLPGYYVESQEPVTTFDSEPEPDVFVARGRAEDYVVHPTAKDTLLVIEVADQTLRRDRNWKRRIYARAGVPVYWIVNLIDQQIEIYTQPSGTGAAADYQQPQIISLAGRVPVVIDGREMGQIAVKDVLA